VKRLATGLFALGLICLGTAPARAGSISKFFDRASFNAAVGPATVEPFPAKTVIGIGSGILNEFTNESGVVGSIVPGDIQPGVTYSTPVTSSFFLNIDEGLGFTGGFLDSANNEPDQPLSVSFNAATGAFAFDTNTNVMGPSFDLQINFSSGGPFVQNVALNTSVPISTLQFFGFESDAVDITSVQIEGTGAGFNFGVDNFTFAAVPEPPVSTLALLGLVSLAWRRSDR